MADQALTIPLYAVPNAYVTQPWVHVDYLQQGMGTWITAETWMDSH